MSGTDRLFVLWGNENGAGCRTLGMTLARQWTHQGKSTLWVRVDPLTHVSSEKQPRAWVPRFKSLSPALLRNYLHDASLGFGTLQLASHPEADILLDLLKLCRIAFCRILWNSPVGWDAHALTVLDGADLLLWICRGGPGAQHALKGHFEKLASLHYPNAFSQIIMNQAAPENQAEFMGSWPAGRRPLAVIPQDSASGRPFHQSLHCLMDILDQRTDLYLSRGRAVETSKAEADVVEEIKNRIKPQLLAEVESRSILTEEITRHTLDACLAEDAALPASREQRQEISAQVLHDVLGLGPVEPLLRDPEVSEVMINGPKAVFVEKAGRLRPTDACFSSETQLRTMIDRIVAPIGRRVDESAPLCDARLKDGSRVNIVLPPLALDGPAVTIRKFPAQALTLADLVHRNSLSPAMADFLESCVLHRKNMLVAGGTGSGKTTLLNALSGLIPEDERIVTIEDAAELRLQKPHVVRMESRPPNAEGEGAVPIRRLVINALRMRPDRIIVGECRSGEALDMLQAMNTGHDGSLTTLHANSPRDALRRLETLVLMAGVELPLRVVREQIQSAVQVLIQQSRLSNGSRKITSITEITGLEEGTITLQELFRFQGTFEKTGLRPLP